MKNKELFQKDTREVLIMPVCPFCKTEMYPLDYHGYYESFPMWICECTKIPGAEVYRGCHG